MTRPVNVNSPSISAALITRNEASRLPRLLERLDWVDEIVVVDGESIDGTAEVALHYGCRVSVHPFDHFAAQRNRALRAARSDWVLSIDADELPSPALASEIRRAMRDSNTAGWRVPIRSRIFGHPFRYSGTQDDTPIRLVRRESATWTGDVHETLRVAGAVRRLEHGFEHDTIPDLATFLAKVERYTTLAAKSRVRELTPPRWRDAFWAPTREFLRRLIWKSGWRDGPPGWAFCALSGWSEWVLARKHRQLWHLQLSPDFATV